MDGTAPKPWCRARIDLSVAAALALLGALAWMPYALTTGFLYDDYAFISHSAYHIDALDSYRPGARAVAAVLTGTFGTHSSRQYGATVLLASMVAATLFVALRTLNVPRVGAFVAAVFCLIFPRADSLRLWWTATQVDVAVILACVSLCLVALWVERVRFGAVALFAGLAILAGAILTYEATAAIVLFPIALLPLSIRWRRTLVALAAQAAVAAVAAAYVYRNTDPSQIAQGHALVDWPRRYAQLSSDGWHVFFSDQLTKISVAAAIVGAVTGAIAAAVLVLRAHRATNPPQERKGSASPVRELLAVGVLIGAGFLAWLPFVPAGDYYTPALPSVGNRVNGVAQLFFLAALGLGLTGVPRFTDWIRPSSRIIVAPVVAVGVMLAIAFATESATDARDFVLAARLRQSILTTVQAALPAPGSGATIVLAGYDRTYSGEIIPVFAATWDFNGAVKLLYGNGSLTGLPLDPAAQCLDAGLVNFTSVSSPIPYQSLRIVNVERQQALAVSSRVACERLLPGLRAPI